MAEVASLKAEARWRQIPKHAQQAILANVWCTSCRKGYPVSDFVLTEDGDVVVIRAHCTVCRGEVARVIEDESM